MSGRRSCCDRGMRGVQENSQMKLQMKREALKKLNRLANEAQPGFDTEKVKGFVTVLSRSELFQPCLGSRDSPVLVGSGLKSRESHIRARSSGG